MISNSILLLIIISLDFILGDPPNWPHPIRWIGLSISKYERAIRKSGLNLKIGSFILVLLSLATVLVISTLILEIAQFIHQWFKIIITIYLLYTSIASKCLDTEARKVYKSISKGELELSREKLSYLVGRDTTQLNFQEITRAVIETVAENTIDGILAPLFYMGIGFFLGLPVQFALGYKVINTLDSMVGYMQEPYKDIGYASAKIDDIANYIPARIGSFFMVLAGGLLGYDTINGFKILKRDRKNHKSPNCAYPESAVAGLLKIQLGGTNTYFGQTVYKPTIGDELTDLTPNHIISTIKIMYSSEILLVLIFILLTIGV